MKVVYFDCPSGASGDMILGALLDAGVPLDALRAELAKLAVPGFRLETREVRRGAFRATKADIVLDQGTRHEHRQLRDILAILGASPLPPAVVAGAERIFTRLAQAEAQVHGTEIEEVHFHEVGAVDAIVDVTGAVIGLHLLGAEGVHVSALPVGGGFVEGAHGRMPIPAPGTAELLRGFPVIDSGMRAELVTPTGAAILTTLATASGRMPAMTVDRIGYGAGTKDFPNTPNILRCFVGETAESSPAETVAQVETTIDDMNPQLYEPLMDRLFEAGALDVFLTPVVMKRSRPGTVLTALCPKDKISDLSRILFEETTTIGIRWTEVSRTRLDREMLTIVTDYGPLPFKVSRLAGRIVTVTPEFAEVVRLAQQKSVPVREVLAQANTAARRHLNQSPSASNT